MHDEIYSNFINDLVSYDNEFVTDNVHSGYHHADYQIARGKYMALKIIDNGYTKLLCDTCTRLGKIPRIDKQTTSIYEVSFASCTD